MTKLTREELHDMLDSLLDTEDKDSGLVDCARFWVFVAELARERGISEEIEVAGASLVAEHHALPDLTGDNAAKEAFTFWKASQGAAALHLLRRLSLPGHETILPPSFDCVLAIGHFYHMAVKTSKFPDPWQYTVGKKGEKAPMAFAARRLIVGAVKYLQAKEEITEVAARKHLLPSEGWATSADKEGQGFSRTWWNWVKEAKADGWVERAVAAAREDEPVQPYAADKQQVAEWWDAAASDFRKTTDLKK